jgi:hypothetical protein
LALAMLSLPASSMGNDATQPSPSVAIAGRLETSTGERPARFTLMCTTGSGGALSLTLRVDPTGLSDFNFDVYEGPGAPAAADPSAHLQVGNLKAPAARVAGWYGDESTQGPLPFTFGIASDAGKQGTAATIAVALAETGAELSWTQDNPVKGGKPLVGHFSLSRDESARVARIAAPCLPATPRH